MSGVKAIAAGSLHGLALKTDGTLWAWGVNENGQVGAGSSNYSERSPVQVMSNVASIAASYYRSAAIKTDGTVWAWGENSGWGGTTPNRPVQILSLRGATGIGAGYGHTMAIAGAGALYAWGSNNAGQLGVPGAASSSAPVKVRDPYSPIAGSAVVWEFYNALIRNGAGTLGAGHYFLTADAAEGAAIDSGAAGAGWQRTGRVFRAWLSQDAAPPGAAGVCRFYARGPNSHFYTADPGECAALKAANPANDASLGWKYESIAFYTVLPVPDPAPAPAGSIAFTAGGLRCAAGYQPVYRVYNARFSPDPALNDSNHRITPSIGDVYRSKTYLGYADEGVAFCSPVADSNEGGDYQAYYLYPGAEAGTAGTFKASYVFSNNGAQRGDGALAYLILPAEVADWGVACTGYNGATCPATMNVDALREGQPVPSFPAGGFIVLTAQGTAPTAPVGTSYAAAISAPGGAPDYLLSNNVPVVSRTVVKSEATCAWVFNPGSLAFPMRRKSRRPGSSPAPPAAGVWPAISPGCKGRRRREPARPT
ncbi:MAG: hypothetical protein IPI73_10590 [Betaproteobacteria bacterium]|nr:hypothetical protein [Betaproteobacteria bacterium]